MTCEQPQNDHGLTFDELWEFEVFFHYLRPDASISSTSCSDGIGCLRAIQTTEGGIDRRVSSSKSAWIQIYYNTVIRIGGTLPKQCLFRSISNRVHIEFGAFVPVWKDVRDVLNDFEESANLSGLRFTKIRAFDVPSHHISNVPFGS